MKILWVVNIPFAGMIEIAESEKQNTSGSWLSAALDGFIGKDDVSLMIVTSGRVKTIKEIKQKNITYCIIPGGYPFEYKYKSKKNKIYWDKIKNSYKPDIITIWGTEFTHGYLALKVLNDIPSVIYIQGLLESISRYYLSGISRKEILDSITIRDIIKLDWITKAQKSYYKRSRIEAEMIRLSGNVIVENNWCSSHCYQINSVCKIYRCELDVRSEFFEKKWDKENMLRFTIMSNAAGYPIKGLHILIKALRIVVKEYPKAMLLIPGNGHLINSNILKKIKESGYSRYIRRLIISFGLQNNVSFIGSKTFEEMADSMSKSNVVVIPSSIENHSSTLIEAMIVGVPCVASYVGGIPEYVRHEYNGLLYRFEEYEMLALYIKKIFSDIVYATSLGNNACQSMRESRSSDSINSKLMSIYKDIIS
jgi:glycosyltransferase involved in cell wall biosynthesis